MVEFHKPEEPQQPQDPQASQQSPQGGQTPQQPAQHPQAPQNPQAPQTPPPPYGAGQAQQPPPPPQGAYGQAPGAQPYGPGPGYGAGYGPGQYPQGPGWGPGYAQPPRPSSNNNAMWTHLGALLTITVGSSFCCGLGGILGWIAPMAIRNNQENRHDPLVRHHGTQAMNLGITQAIVVGVGVVLYFFAFLIGISLGDAQDGRVALALPITILVVLGLLAAFSITSFVFAVIGTVKANRGELWSYPKFIAWPMVKP